MSKDNKQLPGKTSGVVLVLTPVFIFLICAALTAVIGIVPYNKLTTYLNIAFSDSKKSTAAGAEEIIVDGDIKKFEKPADATMSKEGNVVYPVFADQYATITCDAIDLYAPVYWGSSEELLKHGACQLSASPVIGEKGNVVIDAHVNTFFAKLDKLKEGDTVVLNTSYGEFSYKVSKQVTFEKTDKKYVAPSKENKLTLYTCVKQILGSSTQRVAVICEPVEQVFYN